MATTRSLSQRVRELQTAKAFPFRPATRTKVETQNKNAFFDEEIKRIRKRIKGLKADDFQKHRRKIRDVGNRGV